MSFMRVASFFAGVGGIDLAFKSVGFEVIWANELEFDIEHKQHLLPYNIFHLYFVVMQRYSRHN